MNQKGKHNAMEDNKIIDALLADPGTGVQLLLTQYGGLIHAVVRRILPNDPQDAEECAADVLVAAWKHAAELQRRALASGGAAEEVCKRCADKNERRGRGGDRGGRVDG